MDIDAKISLLEAIEKLKPYTHLGYAGAAGTWSFLPAESQYGSYLMVASAVLGVVCDWASSYKNRLQARLAAAPLANGA